MLSLSVFRAREFSTNEHNFSVLVSATDSGGLQGFCNISVVVRDVNRAPRFVTNPISVHIAENAAIGAPVIQIRAEDEDRGENANLHFSIGPDEPLDFA